METFKSFAEMAAYFAAVDLRRSTSLRVNRPSGRGPAVAR